MLVCVSGVEFRFLLRPPLFLLLLFPSPSCTSRTAGAWGFIGVDLGVAGGLSSTPRPGSSLWFFGCEAVTDEFGGLKDSLGSEFSL